MQRPEKKIEKPLSPEEMLLKQLTFAHKNLDEEFSNLKQHY